LFEELVNKALANAEREGSSVGYLFIDLDHFKRVNDEVGHHAGDVVLIEAGVRLRAALRSGDSVGRVGGDEFVVLMPRVTRADLKTVAGSILENLERPISVLGTTVQITGSIGVVLAQSTDSVDSLRRRADNAVYQAKSDGRARCCFSA
jgi:diguanylate cyclase (GGDEF)-like protein